MTTMKSVMKPGDRVTIYCDPITREYREGDAVLVKCLHVDEYEPLERWEVRFVGADDGDETYCRWIRTD